MWVKYSLPLCVILAPFGNGCVHGFLGIVQVGVLPSAGREGRAGKGVQSSGAE